MGRYGRINYSAWDIARPYKTRPQRLRTEHMITPTQLGSLRNAISFDRPPLCSGVISPPPEGLYLWHGKKIPRFVQFSSHPRPSAVDICPHKFVNFASATDEDLVTLTEACDPATFGRGNEDVYDESYRKALKMDASNFAAQLDLAASGLIRTVEE